MLRTFAVLGSVALLAVGIAACDQPDTSLATAPPAAQLLESAQISRLADFKIGYSGHVEAVGALQKPIAAAFSGTGSVVLGQPLRAHLVDTDAQCANGCKTEIIVVGQDRYRRNVGDTSWWVDHGTPLDSYLWTLILPSRLAQARVPRVVGRTTLNGADSWIVEAEDLAGHAFHVWLRTKDGFPLQYESSPNEKASFLDVKITLDHFNSGVTVTQPREDQLSPQLWGRSFRPEQSIPIAQGSVVVHAPKFDCNGSDVVDDSRPDAYPVLVPFTYLAGTIPLTVDPRIWMVYDDSLTAYQPQATGTAVRLVLQTLSSGATTSGSLCFLIPWNQNQVTLIGTVGSGLVSVDLGGLRRPDQTGSASPQ